MSFHPDIHHRRSIRLKGHDYGQPDTYFITVCTHHRAPVFGHITAGKMQLSEAGRMVQSVWEQMDAHYPNILTDAFIVMPDHIHGILHVRAAPRGRPDSKIGGSNSMMGRPGPLIDAMDGRPDSMIDAMGGRPDSIIVRPDRNAEDLSLPDKGQPQDTGQPQGVAPTDVPMAGLSLPDAVHRFKSLTSKRYRDAASCGRLWQRNYWERIVHDETALHAVRRYIRDNPMHWHDRVARQGAPYGTDAHNG